MLQAAMLFVVLILANALVTDHALGLSTPKQIGYIPSLHGEREKKAVSYHDSLSWKTLTIQLREVFIISKYSLLNDVAVGPRIPSKRIEVS